MPSLVGSEMCIRDRIMIKSSSDGIDRSGTSIPLGEYGDGWACTNALSFILAIRRNHLRMVMNKYLDLGQQNAPANAGTFCHQETTERLRAVTPTSMRAEQRCLKPGNRSVLASKPPTLWLVCELKAHTP